MQELKIGITIHSRTEALPFKLLGFLFYFRLLVQPFIISYIAIRANNAGKMKKTVIFMLIFSLGCWASLTSGSRFIALAFSLPMFFLFHKRMKIFTLLLSIFSLVIIATISRHMYLPGLLGGEYIKIYGNLHDINAVTENIPELFLKYIALRVSGISETMMTLGYGSITTDFINSLYSTFSYFAPINIHYEAATFRNIWGEPESAIGGYGLDVFSMYWVFFGGNILTYTAGSSFVAWLMGKSYRFLSLLFVKHGLHELPKLVFVMLLLLYFEARGYLFIPILLVSYFFYRFKFPRIVFKKITLY